MSAAPTNVERALSVEAARHFNRHRGPVTAVAPVPSSRAVFTSGYDGAVAHFDLGTRAVTLLGYHRHLVNRVCLDVSAKRLASCSSDYSIGLWDVTTLRPVRTLVGHSDDVEDFLFVDDSTGVSASRDHRVIVWNLENGGIRRVIEGHEKDVLSLAHHAGRLYSSGDDMTLRVWDIATGKQILAFGPFDRETDTCAIDAERGRAILGCDDGHVRIFDIRRGAMIADIAAHSSGVKKVAVAPPSGDILSAAYDRRLLVWDAKRLDAKVSLERPPAIWERTLTWSADGRHVIAGTFDGTVLCFDAESGRLETEVGESGGEPGNACLNDVSASADGRIVLVSDDGFLRTAHFSAKEACFGPRIEPRSGRVLMNAVALSPNGALLAGGTHDGRLLLLRRRGDGFEEVRAVPLEQGPINTIRFRALPGGCAEIFVGCYSSAIVRLSDDGEVLGRIDVHEGAVKSLRLHPEKPIGASCGADGNLLVWSTEGKLVDRLLGHTAIINDVDLDPSGEYLASVSRDFTAKVYHLGSWRLVHDLPLGRRSLKSVLLFSPTQLFVGDYWGRLIAVDLASGEVRRKTIARNGISALSRVGGALVAASYDGHATILDPATLGELGCLRAMEQRLDAPWEGAGVCSPNAANPG